jgi:hypothetical protein
MALPAIDNFNRIENPLAGNWTTVTDRNGLKATGTICAGSTAGVGNASYWNADAFNDNQYSLAEIKGGGTYQGTIIRVSAVANTFYFLDVVSDSAISLYKCINGSYSQIGSQAAANCTAGHIVKIDANGTTITCYVDGASKISETDSAIASGSAGLEVYDNYLIYGFDNWEGGNVATGGRTTKNTDPWNFGQGHGMSFRMVKTNNP